MTTNNIFGNIKVEGKAIRAKISRSQELVQFDDIVFDLCLSLADGHVANDAKFGVILQAVSGIIKCSKNGHEKCSISGHQIQQD